MKKIIKYEYLIWITLSVVIFVFILPMSSDTLIKIVAGYIFYLFIREVFYKEDDQKSKADDRIKVLKERMQNSPHEKSIYVHEEEKDEDEKKQNLGKYM